MRTDASRVVVKADGVSKQYPRTLAVDNVSLAIRRGEVFGVLGPNGAGKTTLLEMIVGLRRPTGGTVAVLGLDPHRHRAELVSKIGVQPQQANLFPQLHVRETLQLFASFHKQPLAPDDVLAQIGLTDKAHERVRRLSGGQRQRLLIGVALVANPQLLFLDEPTGSLDPHARRQLWELIGRQRELGRTVLLTTHYMEEAQSLCDRVAIMHRGRLVAVGTPQSLIDEFQPHRTIRAETVAAVDPAMLEALPGALRASVARHGLAFSFTIETADHDATLAALLGGALPAPPRNVEVTQATLEDVFLHLTGQALDRGQEVTADGA